VKRDEENVPEGGEEDEDREPTEETKEGEEKEATAEGERRERRPRRERPEEEEEEQDDGTMTFDEYMKQKKSPGMALKKTEIRQGEAYKGKVERYEKKDLKTYGLDTKLTDRDTYGVGAVKREEDKLLGFVAPTEYEPREGGFRGGRGGYKGDRGDRGDRGGKQDRKGGRGG